MYKTHYRVWKETDPMKTYWCVSTDHGKRGIPFIRARNLGRALYMLKRRLARNKERQEARAERISLIGTH